METPEEVLEALGLAQPAKPARRTSANDAQTQAHTLPLATPPTPLEAHADTLLAALGHAPATLEILEQRTDKAEATLQGTLLRLELAGHVSAPPGGRYTRASHC